MKVYSTPTINFKAIKGNPDYEHLEIDATLDDNGNVKSIEYVALYMFGVSTYINSPETSFHNALIIFVESEFKRIRKYRKLEESFRDNLGDAIIIETEETYLMAVKEYNSRTKDMNDDGMKDLNN